MDGIIRSDGAKLSQSIDKQEQRTIITIPRNSRRVLCPFNGMATDSQPVSQSMTVIIDWFDRHQGGRGARSVGRVATEDRDHNSTVKKKSVSNVQTAGTLVLKHSLGRHYKHITTKNPAIDFKWP